MYDLSPVLSTKVALSKQGCVLVLLCITPVEDGKDLIALAVAKISSVGET